MHIGTTLQVEINMYAAIQNLYIYLHVWIFYSKIFLLHFFYVIVNDGISLLILFMTFVFWILALDLDVLIASKKDIYLQFPYAIRPIIASFSYISVLVNDCLI